MKRRIFNSKKVSEHSFIVHVLSTQIIGPPVRPMIGAKTIKYTSGIKFYLLIKIEILYMILIIYDLHENIIDKLWSLA